MGCVTLISPCVVDREIPMPKPAAAQVPTGEKQGRILAYCRVSTDAQAEDGQSLDVQQRQLEGWAMQRGQQLDEVMVEAGVSGAVPFHERPEGTKLWVSLQRGD